MSIDELNETIKKLNDRVNMLSKTKEAICKMISGNKEVICCPKCESHNIVKNGKTNGKQNFFCKNCKKKFNALTNTVFSGLNINYNEATILFDNIIGCTPIRTLATIMKKSTKTIFTLRHKIISCIGSIINNINLTGTIELDEDYIPINLKGTKPEKMPRASKKRSTNGTSTSGINKHKICITSGIDEYDNLFLTVAGTSNVTSKMINDTVLPRIVDSKKVITDCKSSYESIANNNNWNLIQVKAKSHVDENGNSLANINNVHQRLSIFFSNFRGVSTKHLQQYLDLFVYKVYFNWKYEYPELLKKFRNQICVKKTNIKYKNVCDNYSGLNFNEIYSDYNYHPSNITT